MRAAFMLIGIAAAIASATVVAVATEYLWGTVLTGGEDDLGVGVLVVGGYLVLVTTVLGLLSAGSILGIDAMWKNAKLRTPVSVFIVAAATFASAAVAVHVLNFIYPHG
jgi:hypothetical protein